MFLPIIRRFKNFFLKILVNIDKLTKLFFRHYLVCSSQHRAKKDDGYGKFRKREKNCSHAGFNVSYISYYSISLS